MSKVSRNLPIAFALLIGTSVALSQEPAEDDLAAIRASVDSYVTAFNRGDAQALADHWSENGVYISRSSGQRTTGREAMLVEFRALFGESPEARLEVSVDSIRLITPDVAIEDGTATVTGIGEREDTSYTAIHVKRDGQWLLDSVRETVLPEAPNAPSNYEHLKELEWMIGEWVDQDENATVHTVCEWTANRNFLTRSFTVSVKDRVEMAGTQVIGWDPAAQRIREWVFDSNGGFGQGVWSRKGNQWIVKASGVLQDGKKASAVRIITYIDDDRCTVQSISREVDGELLPDVEEFTVVRKPANEDGGAR